jgi:hypothetical protein
MQMHFHLLAPHVVDAALLSAGAAVIGAVISGAISWVRDLGVWARRARVIDEATKCVQFWSQWQKALQEFDDPTNGVRLEAEEQIKRVAENVKAHFHDLRPVSEWSAAEYLAYKASLPRWRRFFLLYIQPSNEARLQRGLVYIGPILLILEVMIFHRWPSLFVTRGDPLVISRGATGNSDCADSLFPDISIGGSSDRTTVR